VSDFTQRRLASLGRCFGFAAIAAIPAAAVAQYGSAAQDSEGPRTHVEQMLEDAYSSLLSAEGLTCVSGADVRGAVGKIHSRYDRLFAKAEGQFGRKPYQGIILYDCRTFDWQEYLDATGRAKKRLDQVERMLKRAGSPLHQAAPGPPPRSGEDK
jgi:hypothetical protein